MTTIIYNKYVYCVVTSYLLLPYDRNNYFRDYNYFFVMARRKRNAFLNGFFVLHSFAIVREEMWNRKRADTRDRLDILFPYISHNAAYSLRNRHALYWLSPRFLLLSGICDQWVWKKVKRPLGSESMPATLGVGPSLSPVWLRFWIIYRLNHSTHFWGLASARSNVGSTVSSYLVRWTPRHFCVNYLMDAWTCSIHPFLLVRLAILSDPVRFASPEIIRNYFKYSPSNLIKKYHEF